MMQKNIGEYFLADHKILRSQKAGLEKELKELIWEPSRLLLHEQ